MSSLFSKLRTLFSARTRGTRRYKEEPGTSGEEVQAPQEMPEVTDAPARQRKVPEVTEAPQRSQAPVRSATPTPQGTIRIEEPKKKEDESDALEEGRVIDLLEDKEP